MPRFHVQWGGNVVRPLIAAQFPDLAYSHALIGYGSDVLGYDTSLSTDHEWGPRLYLILDGDDESEFYRVGDALEGTNAGTQGGEIGISIKTMFAITQSKACGRVIQVERSACTYRIPSGSVLVLRHTY